MLKTCLSVLLILASAHLSFASADFAGFDRRAKAGEPLNIDPTVNDGPHPASVALATENPQ